MFNITRSAEKIGIYFIVATTKRESKIISGRVKSNFLTRIYKCNENLYCLTELGKEFYK